MLAVFILEYVHLQNKSLRFRGEEFWCLWISVFSWATWIPPRHKILIRRTIVQCEVHSHWIWIHYFKENKTPLCSTYSLNEVKLCSFSSLRKLSILWGVQMINSSVPCRGFLWMRGCNFKCSQALSHVIAIDSTLSTRDLCNLQF